MHSAWAPLGAALQPAGVDSAFYQDPWVSLQCTDIWKYDKTY